MSIAAVSVLRTSLAIDDDEVRCRRERAAALIAANGRTGRFQPIRVIAGANPGYLRLPLIEPKGSSSPEPRLGVLRGYPTTLDEHPETRRVLVDRSRPLPGARALRDRLITLPTHSRVAPRDLAMLTEWLGSAPENAAFLMRANEVT